MKKVLIITYYWPPAGGSGVQRWLKFSKYLPENGWKPYIFTPDSPSFEIKDEDLLADIHPETEVWKTPIWEPYSLKDKLFGKSESSNAGIIQDKYSVKNKIMNWVRGNIFIPDPKVFWVKPSIKLLNKKIKEEGITHVVSTGPPHSMHLIALGLKKQNSDLKWISDFRDPWSELDLLNEFHLTKKSKKKYRKLEKEVLQNADVTLTVSETWVESFKRLGSKNVKLITNGFDEEDFTVKEKENDKFIIGHFGLLNHLRNPKNLWKTLHDLCDENPDFNEKLQIRLSGNIDTEVLQNITQYFHLKNKVEVLGYLSHKEVLREYNESSVLLLLLFNSESGIGNYPGKIFEYFASKRPILGFGPKESDTQKLMEKTESGNYHYYEDVNLKENIISLFENKEEFVVSDEINNFTRKKLTKQLSVLLNKM
jgi:glycosyltransferase involved in cell wall biosynthesis